MGRVDDELITIGALARASGLTTSALRFYDDSGLLVPARTDAVTGYRYYTAAQRESAALIRRLRAIDMPLDTVAAVLSGDSTAAGRLLDGHVAELGRRAREAAEVAEAIKYRLGAAYAAHQVTLTGAVLAAAIGQVGPAAAPGAEFPVLAGIFLEVTAESVRLTATDRYRLTTRGLAAGRFLGDEWAVVVDAAELASAAEWLAHLDEVVLAWDGDAVALLGPDSERRFATMAQTFPDYRAMVTASAEISTRVVVERTALVDVIDVSDTGALRITTGDAGLTVSDLAGSARLLPATVRGPEIELWFDSAVLRAATTTAVGPDVMLDISAPDRPVVVRSATDGDLTTLAMPRRNPQTTKGNEC